MPRFFFGLWALGLLLLAEPFLVQGASYDYYVKEGENGDGSEGDPFGSIEDAIEAIGNDKGKKIYVAPGSYGSSVTVPKGTTIVGSNAKEVTVTGDMLLEDDVELRKLGFTGTGDVLVLKNARAVLEDLRFKDINKTAIKTEPGNTVLVLRDSTIEKAGKGMYLQAGTRVEIEGVEVVGGREEGIDIRENVSGYIRKSGFRSNAESGIEIILGSADMAITDNTFLGNSASGVAAQFFDGAKKLGNVRVEGNTFTKNDNYGVDCKAPQEGPDSKFYYLNSLVVINNTFKDNNEGEINKRCRIMTDEERLAFEKEEAAKKALANERATLTLSESALAERLATATASRRATTERLTTLEQEQLESVLQTFEAFESRGEAAAVEVRAKRDSWQCYLGGTKQDEDRINQALQELEILRTRLNQDKLLLKQTSNETLVEERLTTLAGLQATLRSVLESPTCPFSFFGWLSGFWQRKKESLFDSSLASISLFPADPKAKVLFLGTFGYYPRVREVAVRSGDTRLVEGLTPVVSDYVDIVASLRLPLGTETDPLPPLGAASELSFPVRFANIFSATNIRTWQVSGGAGETSQKDLEKTVANFEYADARVLGPAKVVQSSQTSVVGGRKLHWVDYQESDDTSMLIFRETIAPLKEKNELVVVLLSWDEKQGKVMTPKREALVRDLVQAGAALVIGTGVMAPFEQKLVDGVPFYFSLGSAFEKFQTGDASKKSVALEMQISLEGKLEVAEKNLTFTAEKGLEILP